MSDHSTKAKSGISPESVTWSNAIKELIEEAHTGSKRSADWPKDLVFPRPGRMSNSNDDDGDQSSLLVRLTLISADKGYRLGYATQLLLEVGNDPQGGVKDGFKPAIKGDEDIRSFLLLFDYVHRLKDVGETEEVKDLCMKVYRQFFNEGLGDDNMDEHIEATKKKLDKMWGDDDFPPAKPTGPDGSPSTPFLQGMEQAIKDCEAGLESEWWKKLEEFEWNVRYLGITKKFEENLRKRVKELGV